MKHEVRITGGEFKGRKIKTPGEGTHPMGERERLALFNMLGDRVKRTWVMDLFAGSGALGIEALSRGANFVLFIDNDQQAVKTINDNLMKLGIYGERGGAIHNNIKLAARTATDRYPIVIADPPYDEYDERILKHLQRLVSRDGLFVLSHPGEAPEIKDLELETSRKYASCTISIYHRK